jgi:hypothetical protein
MERGGDEEEGDEGEEEICSYESGRPGDGDELGEGERGGGEEAEEEDCDNGSDGPSDGGESGEGEAGGEEESEGESEEEETDDDEGEEEEEIENGAVLTEEIKLDLSNLASHFIKAGVCLKELAEKTLVVFETPENFDRDGLPQIRPFLFDALQHG